ncbi:cyclic pyranopterin phosphate synthase [Rhodoferax sp. OV413]|uniref:GTP 3',8-cyclase MoaA n=1 Tax=Rhodoferax sp. OV413 TaxID=1855285 RepID=UPI00088B6A1D|nr:GTP 3',8-cyclase MoaA [Rhodoferax sp. OV413]SDO16300.1 cyclic pyranopterin phosphate synthase [Rhodoferax sp. OV413]
MNHRVIPLFDQRLQALHTAMPATMGDGPLADQLGRPLHDLRISVTDRCNFRCSYCMPKAVFDKDYPYLPHSALLSFEEITRVASVFAAQGVRKIRLTGGEPLLRKNIEVLIAQLAALRTPDGQPLDLTLTTNGALLARKAQALKDAGLQRLTVSLDGLDDTVFRRMNDVDFPVRDVLDGLEAAHKVGLGQNGGLKVNMVVQRGTNEHEILPMAERFKGTGMVLRFIEYMDVGATNGWRMDQVVPSAEVIQTLQDRWPLRALEANAPGETAQRWAYADGSGEVGVISSVTQAFCADCSRARLSTDGKLFLCLFASQGHDLRGLLRGGADNAALANAIRAIWQGRSDRYSALRAAMAPDTGGGARRVEMSYIGG